MNSLLILRDDSSTITNQGKHLEYCGGQQNARFFSVIKRHQYIR
jgi:hypothetical protein